MTPTLAKPRVRRGHGAVLIDGAHADLWHAAASALPGLSNVESDVLRAVADLHRDLRKRGYAGGVICGGWPAR